MNPRWSTLIPDEQAGEVLRWYEGLEEQVIDFISVVPPHGDNLGEGELPNRPNLEKFAKRYSPLLRLPERTAILLTDTPELRKPFRPWADLPHGEAFQSPEWWKLYNRSKHRRIEAFSGFTLTMAIDALAGALVVISTVPAFTAMLVRREWLFFLGSSTPREGLILDYHQTLVGQRSTPSGNDWPFIIEARLFALPIGHGQFPDNPKDFDPLLCEASPRLRRWFGKL
jgi:hypothetical protein